MQSALIAKEILHGDTPLFFFDVKFASGLVKYWSTRTMTWSGRQYDARVVKSSLFEAQMATDTGIGGVPRLTFELANADSALSQIEQQVGFRGGKVTVTLGFVDMAAGVATSESCVVFQGVLNAPEAIGENVLRLTAMNRMSMQRAVLPEVRVQRMCPWRFPSTNAQRVEALDGATRGRYSPLFRCGYSPDQTAGVGNLNGSVPFTRCANTRSDCQQRGMFTKDSSNRATGRFGGFEFVPASILVRGNGQSSSQISAVQDNQARYNDFIPLVYGTQWHTPDVVFTRNDGNLTRMEVLLGMGEIEGVLNVLVNGVELPRGVSGRNMTATGWYNVVSWGSRNGTQNGDFADAAGVPSGDPYGSMAYLSVVVPNRLNNGTSIPKVQVLMQGLKLYRFDANGDYTDQVFSDNPAWVLLDILGRSGWTLDELDKGSFARGAAYASDTVSVIDPAGGAVTIPRFQCNFALKDRRSAGEVIRSVRNSSRMYIVQNSTGLLELRVENTFALQQPVKSAGSNSTNRFQGGWPMYEFDESSIARKSDGSSSVVILAKGSQDTPNRYSVEFQDSLNQYQQDSLSLGDGDDIDLCGQEVAVGYDAAGISTFSQAARMVLLAMNKSVSGNRYISFETSIKGLGLVPGDLITVGYAKEGLNRVPFRVTKLAPSAGFRSVAVSAQIHDDNWYSDSTDVLGGALGRQPGLTTGLPQPVVGTVLDGNGNLQLGVAETESTGTDGAAKVNLALSFVMPSSSVGNLAAPLIGLTPTILGGAGSMMAGLLFYYSISAVDSAGLEGQRSFRVEASTGNTIGNAVRLTGIQLPSGATSFHVYRGTDPRLGFRIASNVPASSAFVDTGLPVQHILPPDPLADHFNAYWRWELMPESLVTGHGATMVAHAGLQLPVNAYTGSRVLITRGQGAGQERKIVSNTSDTLTTDIPWTIEPNASSFFSLAENAWRFGCTGSTAPLTFDIPERIGAGVHLLLRTATIDDQESTADISPLTRWILGQSGGLTSDSGVPPTPVFAVSAPLRRPGALELSPIAFPTFVNTRGIFAGTFKLYYFDELNGTAAAIGADWLDTQTAITLPFSAVAGDFIQVGQEICGILSVGDAGAVAVRRGQKGTVAAVHASSSRCFLLQYRVVVVPFVKNFFGSPASGTWTYLVDMPNVRVSAADLTVSNAFGDSASVVNSYTRRKSNGLRTLSGGQISFQVGGYLSAQTGAAPDIVIDKDRSLGNISATLRTAPVGGPVGLSLCVNGVSFGVLTLAADTTYSNVLNGVDLPVLRAGDLLRLDVTEVGVTSPGSDLTVTIPL